ncbi:DUF4806 domain-containing protein, partial [Aphis craccivora]
MKTNGKVYKHLITSYLFKFLRNLSKTRKLQYKSSALLLLKPNVTIDFQRKPHGVNEVSRWKTTKFGTFVLYLGSVVLKNIISEEYNLLPLTTNISENLLKFVNELVIYFVRTFEEFYGNEWISHNVHSFQHIYDDYRRCGSLADNCSAFPFENHNIMSTLKKLIRKSNQPLQQVVKRYAERTQFKPHNQFYTFNKIYNFGGPLLLNLQIIKINNKADCYVQTIDKNIIKVDIVLHLLHFYKRPLHSSKLCIHLVNDLNSLLESWPTKLTLYESLNKINKFIIIVIFFCFVKFKQRFRAFLLLILLQRALIAYTLNIGSTHR